MTRDALARIDMSRVLASFDTYFSRRGDQEPRARNIEAAASHVDGLVMRPGEVESASTTSSGPAPRRTASCKAFEIYKGEFVEGMGGGTCQVASTVHATAFFGGLDIVERLPHSRPSAYIPAGLDATVVYPTVDLKFRNPFTFPVVFHATVTGNALHVDLLGADKPVTVELRQGDSGDDALRRAKSSRTRRSPKPKRKQKGTDGVELRRSRILAFATGRRASRRRSTVYPPTLEIWKVPPGYDAITLPPLGEDLPPPEPAPGDAVRPASAVTPAAPARI